MGSPQHLLGYWGGNVLVKAWIGSFGVSGCAHGFSCAILFIALWGWGCGYREEEMGVRGWRWGMRMQEWGCCAITTGADREICCVFGKFRGRETKPCTLSSSLPRVLPLCLSGGESVPGTRVSTVWGGCSKHLQLPGWTWDNASSQLLKSPC